MKITIEMDNNIRIDGHPELAKCVVEQDATTLPEALQLVKQALLGIGYCFDGELVLDNPDGDIDNE
jgi:hypothetical protein